MEPRGYVNAIYYPSWRAYKGNYPSNLQIDKVTHIFYAFASVDQDGSLRYLDKHADLNMKINGDKGCLAALAAVKGENPTIKTILSIGGGSSSEAFAILAASDDSRQRFASQVKSYLDRHCLDGVDIDWEHPDDAEKGSNYILLLKTLRGRLSGHWYLLTSALPVGEWCLKHIDMAAAARMLDFLNLMGYDFVGPWTPVAGHHSQLYGPDIVTDTANMHPSVRKCCAAGIQYVLAQGFPGRKLLLGVPAYARYFVGACEPGQIYTEAGEVEYRDLPVEWIETATVDEARGAAYIVHENERLYHDNDDDDATVTKATEVVEGKVVQRGEGKEQEVKEGECKGKGFVSFDVPATARAKARYVKEVGLGGLFYWHGSGDRQGPMSLVAAGHDELHRSNPDSSSCD